MDDGAETVPLELRRTALTVGESSDHVAHGPQLREGRRELWKGAGVLAEHREWSASHRGEPEGNLLLESNVTGRDGAIKSCRPGSRERQRLDIDICARVGGIGEWGRVIRPQDRRPGGQKGGMGAKMKDVSLPMRRKPTILVVLRWKLCCDMHGMRVKRRVVGP